MTGKILKCIGGFYTVLTQTGELTARAAGKFRLDEITPLTGDICELDPTGEMIDKILPRKNYLVRPKVANVDIIAITIAAKKPLPDLLLVDKLLVCSAQQGIEAILIINKSDISKKPETIAAEYFGAEVRIIITSAVTGEGTQQLREAIRGKTTVFAGQSAVGKSSLINAIAPSLALTTGELAKKTARGRHTTRSTELLAIDNLGTAVIDSPGFSVFFPESVEPEDLRKFYPEFACKCKYSGCLHECEQGCEVIEAVRTGKIDKNRYERYIKLLLESKKQKEEKYD